MNIQIDKRSTQSKFIIVNHIQELFPEFLNSFDFKTGKIIGRGGFGSVYESQNDNKEVVKIQQLCRVQDEKNTKRVTETEIELCRMAQDGSLIFKVPCTLEPNSFFLLTPNYFSELLISEAMTHVVKDEISPHFPIFKKGFYDIKQQRIVSIFEKLEPIYNHIVNPTDFTIMLLGVAHGLAAAQQENEFTHYDLHCDNILIRSYNKPFIFEYETPSGYTYVQSNFIPIINDFGFTSIRGYNNKLLQTTRIIPRSINTALRKNRDFDPMNNYYYNPYTDLLTLFGSIYLIKMYPKKDKVEEDNFNDNIINYLLTNYKTYAETLIGAELNDKNMSKFLSIYNGYWRPDISRALQMFPRMLTPFEFFETLSNKYKFESENPKEILDKLEKDKIIFRTKRIDPKLNISLVKSKSIHQPPQFLKTIDIIPPEMFYKVPPFLIRTFGPNDFKNMNSSEFDKSIPEFHRTADNKEICSTVFQFATVAQIDINLAKRMNFSFRFDCCRLDLQQYFKTTQIRKGIAINASFFDIKKSYTPIGKYKWEDTRIYHEPIPKKYDKFYGYIAIDNSGNLTIGKGLLNDAEIELCKGYMEVGPLLVFNKRPVISSEMLRTFDSGEYIFQCANPDGKENEFPLLKARNNLLKAQYEDKCITTNLEILYSQDPSIPNCIKLKPGELSHGANPNPRSALCITDNEVLFVYVEGRGKRGMGMDLKQLAQFCLLLGAKAAINLDGGQSSSIVWKDSDVGKIFITNPNKLPSYPIGNLISLIG